MTVLSPVQSAIDVEDLVGAARNGNTSAQAELYTCFYDYVRGEVARCLSWSDVDLDDLTQDTFIHAFKHLNDLREAKAFASWIRMIARRISINHILRKRKHHFSTVDLLFVCDDFKLEIEFEELRVALKACLAEMRELDRKALELFYLDGYDLVDSAKRANCPIGTMKRRLHVARKRLAAKVCKVFEDPRGTLFLFN